MPTIGLDARLDAERNHVSLPSQSSSSSHHTFHASTRSSTTNTPWLRHRPLFSKQILLLIVITCFLSLSSASVYISEQMVEVVREDVPVPESDTFESTIARLARSGTILVDQRPPPQAQDWRLSNINDDLQRRDLHNVEVRSVVSSSSSSFVSKGQSTATTLASTTTSSGIAAATSTGPVSLPTPFDVGFSSNITTNCQSFMSSMLNNATFKTCLPFSLLLQNSNSFFQTSKSILRITQTLDYACAANFTQCASLMSSLASNITSDDACSTDLDQQNPLIEQAKLGLLAYKPLYTASCLRNPSTSSYCFADAITNASNPTDSYIYFLPLNVSLVGGSQPTCDSCLKSTMAVFEQYGGDRSSALASDYTPAAMQVNVNCGPGFVNQTLALSNSAPGLPASGLMGGGLGLWILVAFVASWLL